MSQNMKDDSLYAMRHSLAHIMAASVIKLWPVAKLGVGPVVDNGFYYDIDIEGVKISEEDFDAIEKAMREIVKNDEKFVRSEKTIEEALKWANDNKQPYKTELLNDLQRSGTTVAKDLSAEELGTVLSDQNINSKVNNVSFYTNGDFSDLCRGPHADSTGKTGYFKLIRIAGAYWRGQAAKPQMQRLYGVAFATELELKNHLEMLEEAKKRDHRKLGRELDLFTHSDLVGAGLPLFTPRGTVLRELLGRYSQQLRQARGFERVWTPHITKTDLYKMSGHWEKFGDELMLVESQETSDAFVMKPMNCPHHIQIYNSNPRSYKDMPIRYMENTTDYRDEKTGELHGLSRVRSLTQDDSHAFVTTDQIEKVASDLIEAAQELYSVLGMKLIIELSFRDNGDAYLGEAKLWESAQSQLEAVAKKNKLDYRIIEGEAAFYGPKIDFRAVDAIGRTWQLSTVQLDFVQPERFGLQYTDNEGNAQRPVMIHCALLGSMERFLSIYIEHTAGRFPFWLAPEQIRILTINNETDDYVSEVEQILYDIVLMGPLRFNELRVSADKRNESLGKKIREAENFKVPVIMIIGPKDKEARQVSVRASGEEKKVSLEELKSWVESIGF